MSSTALNLLDLPRDIINEVLLRLDLKSIDNIEKTCTTLEDQVKQFKESHKEFIARKMLEQKVRILLAGDEDSDDYADYDDFTQGTDSDVDDIQRLMEDVYDRASWGSNYDEECEELVDQL